MTYALAVGAALANALTTILQRLGVQDAPRHDTLHLRLLAFGVRRRVWLVGVATMTAGFVFQAAALHFGPLTSVQPVLTLELPLLVGILGVWFGVAVGWREWAGAFLGAGGLVAFLLTAEPRAGPRVPDLAAWLLVSCSVAAACALAVGLAQFGPSHWRAAMYGASAAIMFAFAASLIREVMIDASQHLAALYLHWQLYAMAVAGLLAFFLAQNAFHAGPVTASQPTLVLVDPLASIGIGIGLFGDQLRTGGGRGAVESLALIALCAGGVILARSPVIVEIRASEGSATGPSPAPVDLVVLGGLGARWQHWRAGRSSARTPGPERRRAPTITTRRSPSSSDQRCGPR
ncbi:MAG: DMT family transporter [Actinomycetota bacterium]|nr:DMT family transporter [Actinomycetota bacterium]